MPPEIAEAIALFRGGLIGARWIEPADYHITLRFIGDVDRPLAREIDAELSRIQHNPITISVGGLDSFGGKKPRAIVAKVTVGRDLITLQGDNERAIRKAGGNIETRKFLPHVTIARLRNGQPGAVADYLGTRSLARSWQFTADEFVLYSARNSIGGGPYHVEATYPLLADLPVLRPANSQ